MSTVLWANQLAGGVVTSDQSDKYALYKHADKLDAICRRVRRQSFKDLFDTTDLEFNLGDGKLPPGMESTDEVMAASGKWVAASEAASLLAAAIAEIEAKKPRFGLLRDDHAAVVEELKESLAYAREAEAKGARFNFSVVM